MLTEDTVRSIAADALNPQPPESGCVASICRCSSPAEHAARAEAFASESAYAREQEARAQADTQVAAANARAAKIEAELSARSPNVGQYSVERVERIGTHLVMQVRYPNCTACAYEGLKTMVFLDVTETAALRWRRIDPHFRKPSTDPTEAPPPAARFPGSKDGWTDAVTYARGKAHP